MTSHIFVAMGMWDDVERANVAAWEASNRRNGHYTQWRSYGQLQKGRVKESRAFVDAILEDAAADVAQGDTTAGVRLYTRFLANRAGSEGRNAEREEAEMFLVAARR